MSGNVKPVSRTCGFFISAPLKARNCRHIQTTKKEVGRLDIFTSDPASKEMAAEAFAEETAKRAVSHLPISPPEWCRLPADNNEIPRVSFQGGRNLPSRFTLDSNSRCSCGETESSLPVTDSELIIYTSSGAIYKTVEKRYCPSCRNTKGCIGPDLREYGVFNWNNTIAFSHELMHSYTSQFTTSETPIFAFHQTVINTYLNERSPKALCSLRTFVLAYFAFARLVLISSKMECPQCGPNPPIVIADGVSISFPKHRLESLKPPTISDKSKSHVRLPRQSTKSTCFIGSHKVRVSIQKALDEEKVHVGKSKLLSILINEVVF